MDPFVPIGYFPKDTTVPVGWADSDRVNEICSVSDCISSGPKDCIERWIHNDYGYYNSELDAVSVCGESEIMFRVLEFRMMSTVFTSGESAPFAIPEVPIVPFSPKFKSIGFDVANGSPGRNIIPFLGCSPLSCNGMAREIPVNEFCLLDSLELAIALAKRFSIGEAEPGPYFVVEILRQPAP